MALVQTGTPVYYPPTTGVGSGIPSFTSTAISTAGYKTGLMFQSPVTDTITHVSFRTGTTNAGTVNIRIETYDTSTGFPSGTLWATNTSASYALLASDDNLTIEVALTAAASVNAGDFVCIVIESASSFTCNITNGMGASSSQYYSAPNCFTNLGTWATRNSECPVTVPKFGTNGYIYMDQFMPAETVTTRTFNNTSTPDVRGNKITFPFGGRIRGFWAAIDLDGAATATLYADDASTVLGSVNLYTNVPPNASGLRIGFDFATGIDVTAGQTVYLVIEPTSDSNVSLYELAFDNTDIKAVYCANSIAVSAKDPTGSSDYTEVSTSSYAMGLFFSRIDNGIPATAANPLKGYIA